MPGDLGWDAFWRLYESGAWEPNTKALIDKLGPGDLYVDIGAWIGPTVRWAVERGAYVIAVEPDGVACAELYRFDPGQVEVWRGAVAPVAGYAYLSRNPEDGGVYGDSMSRLGDDGVRVQTWTIQDILQGRKPALVKVDVEGYEIALLPSLMEALSRPTVIQVSLHGAFPPMAWFEGWELEVPGPHGDLVIR